MKLWNLLKSGNKVTLNLRKVLYINVQCTSESYHQKAQTSHDL